MCSVVCRCISRTSLSSKVIHIPPCIARGTTHNRPPESVAIRVVPSRRGGFWAHPHLDGTRAFEELLLHLGSLVDEVDARALERVSRVRPLVRLDLDGNDVFQRMGELVPREQDCWVKEELSG